MPNIKVQAQDGKYLTIPIDPTTDPKEYDGIVEDALNHYNSSLQPAQPDATNGKNQIAGMPVYNTPIGQMADWTVPLAKWVKSNAVQPVKDLGSDIQSTMPNSTAAQVLGGGLKLGANALPSTPGEVKAFPATMIAGELGGQALGASLKVPGVPEALQALSRLPANLVQKVVDNPEILSRYLPIDEAGDVMSKFFGQLGLKSGSGALEAAGDMGKAAPKLGDYASLADDTVQRIKNQSQIMSGMTDLEKQAAQLNGKLQQIQAVKQSLPGMDFSQTELNLGQQLSDIKGQYQALQSKLPNAQDALATRVYMSKMAVKQAQQATENHVVQPILQKNLGLVDNYLDSEVDRLTTEAFKEGKELSPISVPGYGEITTPAQVRQVYHEAKIGDAFSSLFPQNRNGQVDSLRTLLGVLSGHPAATVAQSPAMWGNVIRGASAAATEGAGALTGAGVQGAGDVLSGLVTPQDVQK